MKFLAKIIINDIATEGRFTKSFLKKMFKMGAELTIIYNFESNIIDTKKDFDVFLAYTKRGK